MTKFDLIKKSVKSFYVFWSESTIINQELRSDNNGDIEKEVGFDEFIALCDKAIQAVDGGYDKTKVKINFYDGSEEVGRLDLGDYLDIQSHLEAVI